MANNSRLSPPAYRQMATLFPVLAASCDAGDKQILVIIANKSKTNKRNVRLSGRKKVLVERISIYLTSPISKLHFTALSIDLFT